ncbi:hypothetical protein HON03_01385 [archaeon]|nr:hypothetical protein [archaeon]MBT5288469.1 hypothetical protein [archaeon]
MIVSDLKEAVKKSFSRVKNHFEALEGEVRHNRDYLIKQNNSIESLNAQIKALEAKIKELEDSKLSFSQDINSESVDVSHLDSPSEPETSSELSDSSLSNDISIGNRGVSLDGYSLPGYSLPSYSLDIRAFKEDLSNILSRLSRQEFMTFLVIYQQEEQIKLVTYESLSKELKISSGCVRTYVSGIIKKGIPIVKSKYNNKVIILSVPSEIRGLNLKKRLIQIFYNLDPSQKKLGDKF